MIPIFDLDDTLYPERTFVESGFRAVTEMLKTIYGWEPEDSLRHMLDVLEMHGRGAVFNELLESKKMFSTRLVRHCLQVYRQHSPRIALYSEAQAILDAYRDRPMYLVTDGNKNVQAKKVHALGIEPYFRRVFITHRYGVRNAKPSVYCFDLIRKLERCEWSDMAYVGDNPAKDFVNLTPLGVRSIRVLTGEHRNVKAKPHFEATLTISNLSELLSLL